MNTLSDIFWWHFKLWPVLNIIPTWTDLFQCGAQTWKVIMFTQGGVLRLKEGVELSSGNSFSKQPERINPAISPKSWLAAFIALLWLFVAVAGMAPGSLSWGHAGCWGRKLDFVVPTRLTNLICGVWLFYFLVLFFSFFLFQLWSNGSYPELTSHWAKGQECSKHNGACQTDRLTTMRQKIPPGLCHWVQYLRRRVHVISGLHCRLNFSLCLASDLNFKHQPKHNLNLSTGYWSISSLLIICAVIQQKPKCVFSAKSRWFPNNYISAVSDGVSINCCRPNAVIWIQVLAGVETWSCQRFLYEILLNDIFSFCALVLLKLLELQMNGSFLSLS